MRFKVLLILILSISQISAQDKCWKTSNLAPGIYTDFAANYNNGSIYTCDFSGTGVWKSIDSGKTWNNISSNLPDGNVYSLTVDNDGFIYISLVDNVFGGVFRSSDEGISWQRKGSGLPHPPGGPTKIICNLKNDSLYLGSSDAESGGMFRSGSKGESWLHSNVGLEVDWDNFEVLDITFSKKYLFIGLYVDAIYRSPNNGYSWESVSNGVPIDPPNALVVDSTNYLFAGFGNGKGVYFSTDEGESWSEINDDIGDKSITSLVVDKRNNLYAGTANGVYFLKFGRTWWQPVNCGLNDKDIISLGIAADGTTLLAGTRTGVYLLGADGVDYTTDFIPETDGFYFKNHVNNLWNQDYWNSLVIETYNIPKFLKILNISNVPQSTYPDWDSFEGFFGFEQTRFASGIMNYKPSAILIWYRNSGEFTGNHIGMAASALSYYNNIEKLPDSVKSTFSVIPEGEAIIDITKNTFASISEDYLAELGQKKTLNPKLTLSNIRRIISTEKYQNPYLLLLNDDDKLISKTLIPYKIKADIDGDYSDSVYVYDPDYPGDNTKAVLIDGLTGNWKYDDIESYEYGLIALESAPGNNSNIILNGNNNSAIYFQPDAKITFTTEEFVLLNSDLFEIDFNDAAPIIPSTGGVSKICGYYLPGIKNDEVTLDYKPELADNYITYISPKSCFDVTFKSEEFGRKSSIIFDPSDFSLNLNTVFDMNDLSIAGIDKLESSEFYFRINLPELKNKESISLNYNTVDQTIEIINSDKDNEFDIYLQNSSANSNPEFSFRSINIRANNKHAIWVKNLNDFRDTVLLKKYDTKISSDPYSVICLSCIQTDIHEEYISGLKIINHGDYIYIQNPESTSDNFDISLYDLSGRMLKSMIVKEHSCFIEFNISDLNNGFYYIIVNDGKEYIIESILKYSK